MTRFPSREVNIGNCPLGASNPIRLQSMTNTAALDIRATVSQAIRIFEAGADYVRISAPNRQSALNLKKIKSELKKAGFDKPLIADIHFNPDLALIAAPFVEKVRINPGNYNGPVRKGQTDGSKYDYEMEIDQIKNNIAPLLKACKQYSTAIRIGTNFGSLSQRIISRYGNTPEGMVQSTIEFLKIFEDQGFYDTVISLKASNPLIMIQSYLLMVDRMMAEGMNYPLHLGVTEAGEGENGRIKSTLGISTLLQAGIGDTLRVSLSEAPEAEVPVARKIAEPFQKKFSAPSIPSRPFTTQPLDWQNENPPSLPCGLKAMVIQTSPEVFRREIHFHPGPFPDRLPHEQKNRPDLIFFLKENDANTPESKATNKDRVLNTITGEDYPILKASWISKGNYRFDSAFNFIFLDKKPDKGFLLKLKGIPGLIILFSGENEKPAVGILALWHQLKNLGISAALLPRMTYHEKDPEDFLLQLTSDWGRLLLERKIHGLWVENQRLPAHTLHELCFGLLQATGLRITKTEFISCPTCARTSFDLLNVLQEVKAKTSHLPGLKIAVMGCVVNGPGEMADADYGIMGAGQGKVHIFRGSRPILKNIPQGQAAATLLDIINKMNLTKLK